MVPPSTFCTFKGTTRAISVHGAGPTVLVEPTAFISGIDRIQLIGAKLFKSSPGSEVLVAGPRLDFLIWEHFEPVNMHGDGAFKARYEVVSSSPYGEREVSIELAPGGTNPGWFLGAAPGDGACVEQACKIQWNDGTSSNVAHKVLRWASDGSRDAQILGTLPGGGSLSEVSLHDAEGQLECDGRSETGEWSRLDWRNGSLGALRTTNAIRVSGRKFTIEIENDAPPLRPIDVQVAGAAVVALTSLAITIAVMRKRRRRSTPVDSSPTMSSVPDAQVKDPVRIFISYAREDRSLLDELVAHLSVYTQTGLMSIWEDRCIHPGDRWQEEISDRLDQAEIVIALISADFIHSTYCMGAELKRAMQLEAEGLTNIVPVIVRDCAWQEIDLAERQTLPRS